MHFLTVSKTAITLVTFYGQCYWRENGFDNIYLRNCCSYSQFMNAAFLQYIKATARLPSWCILGNSSALRLCFYGIEKSKYAPQGWGQTVWLVAKKKRDWIKAFFKAEVFGFFSSWSPKFWGFHHWPEQIHKESPKSREWECTNCKGGKL